MAAEYRREHNRSTWITGFETGNIRRWEQMATIKSPSASSELDRDVIYNCFRPADSHRRRTASPKLFVNRTTSSGVCGSGVGAQLSDTISRITSVQAAGSARATKKTPFVRDSWCSAARFQKPCAFCHFVPVEKYVIATEL